MMVSSDEVQLRGGEAGVLGLLLAAVSGQGAP